MKARLIKDKNGDLLILCCDGTIANANKKNLHMLLTSFHLADKISGDKKVYWNREYPEMVMYPGEEYAMVTDAFQLVLSNFAPFHDIYKTPTDTTELVSSIEYAKQQGKSVEQIKIHCRNGRIPGAVKISRDWMIPKNAPYPTDRRRAVRAKK